MEVSPAMKIILANPRGFCAGVNMAIESLERALELLRAAALRLSRDRPQQVRRRAVPPPRDRLRRVARRGPRRGSPALQRPRRLAPDPRAGPPPQAPRHRRHLPARHQGPPRSRQVRQRRIHHRPDRPRGARRGHRHDGRGPRPHDPGRDRRGRRAARTSPIPTKVAYLTQTTLSVDDANVVIAALRKKFPKIANPPKDDICYATQNRQEAVRELAPRGRRGARAGQPEQLEQQAAGRDRPTRSAPTPT